MASAEQYAQWLIDNQDKSGTPDFQTVADAYRQLRAGSSILDEPMRGLGIGLGSVIKGSLMLPSVFGNAYGYLTKKAFPNAAVSTDIVGDVSAMLPDWAQPKTRTEKLFAKGEELAAGVGGPAMVAKAAAMAAPSSARGALAAFSNDIPQQVVSAFGSGAASEQAKQMDAPWYAQMLAATGGGLAGAATLGGVRALGRTNLGQFAQSLFSKPAPPENVLLRNGVDPATIAPAMRRVLAEDVAKAETAGIPIDEQYLARLAAYRNLELTPTRARITQSPADVTREQNAARLGVNTGYDAGLANIANANNAGLIDRATAIEAPLTPFAAGERVLSPIAQRNAQLEAAKRGAYSAANTIAGGDVPIERGMIQDAIKAAEASNKLPFVPDKVMTVLNQLSVDESRPFTVGILDQLKTVLANAAMSPDGNVRMAVGAIRKALDDAPIVPVKRFFGGDQVVTQAGAGFMSSADRAPQTLMDALNTARAANRTWRQWQESTPGIEAVASGAANPSTFVDRFILSKNQKPSDVAKTLEPILASADATQAVRSQVMERLLSSAVSGDKFSGLKWAATLKSINPSILERLFTPEEMRKIRDIGLVGQIETNIPRGAAPNTSNTAFAAANLIGKIGQVVRGATPLSLLAAPIYKYGVELPAGILGARQALNVGPALTGSFEGGLLGSWIPAAPVMATGLLSSP